MGSIMGSDGDGVGTDPGRTDGMRLWTAVSGGSTAYDTNAGSHRACFTDPNPVTSGTVQYRVSANGYTSYTNVWEY